MSAFQFTTMRHKFAKEFLILYPLAVTV